MSAALCPLCGEPNRCALAGSSPSEDSCWCVGREFPASLVEAAPDRTACICETCREAAVRAQEGEAKGAS
jgi:hypothetical protein